MYLFISKGVSALTHPGSTSSPLRPISTGAAGPTETDLSTPGDCRCTTSTANSSSSNNNTSTSRSDTSRTCTAAAANCTFLRVRRWPRRGRRRPPSAGDRGGRSSWGRTGTGRGTRWGGAMGLTESSTFEKNNQIYFSTCC